MERLKRILIIVSSTDDITDEQIECFKSILGLMVFNVDFILFDENIQKTLSDKIFNYEYVYLFGHSDDKSFGSEDYSIPWIDLADFFKKAFIFSDDSVLIIQSCSSGSQKIANYFLDVISKLSTVIGFKDNVLNLDSYISTLIILYLKHREFKNLSLIKSVDIAKKVTNLNITIFSRND